MNPVRPGLPPPLQLPATTRAPEPARAAAQRAFFELAAGKADRPQASASAAPAAANTAAREAAPAPGAQPATRLPRPGSLLDIKV